jgi:predicted transcriptional regulator
MSLVELKREVDRLSDAERRELESYLRERADKNVEARRERVSAIMREMDAGRKFSRSDLERVDRELTERGL